MDLKEYRQRGKEMVDYIADYLGSIRERRVFPDVKPGYMRNLIPADAPATGEDWDSIFGDIERVIMPGMTHWQSPYMHAYFPALNSPPSLLGDMLADAINCLGFTWASSPACTELETIVMDWLGKMIGLPAKFLHSNTGTRGGGVIQTTASEATFVCLLAARTEAIKRVKAIHPELDPSDINGRLVCYCSDQAHSSVEKASLVGLVKLRLLPSDDELSLRGETLRDQVERDRREGLIPFFLCATVGTTGACSFDKLLELGPICAEEDIWMHIDAAYAGSSFVCPEFRPLMAGVEFAQSFAFNPSKWLMVHFDCTAMWVQNSGALHRTFNVQPLYLKHENTGAAIDYMHWQVPLSRRFRSLKLWFVLRSYGVKGLQEHLREGVRLATMFEGLVLKDKRFEIPAKRHLGMVVFRLKGENDLTELLLTRLNKSGKLHCVPAAIKGKYIIRFTVTSTHTTEDDIRRDWYLIQVLARRVLVDMGKLEEGDAHEELEEYVPEEISAVISNIGQQRREGMKRKDYGLSLILSNVPMSPKFINGSFAAMFDNADNIAEYARHLSRRSIDFNGQPIRLSPRKRLKEQSKQYSFDLSQRRVEPLASTGANGTASNRRQQPQRQASLDSKIEEIFENSMEDQQRPATNGKGDTNGQTAPQRHRRRSAGGKREKKEPGENDEEREEEEDDGEEEEDDIEDEEEEEEDADGVVTVTMFQTVKKSRRRAVQLVDKAVQSPTSPPPYQTLEAAGSRSDSPSDTVLVTLERSPSTINGLTPLICKHCGHGVED